MRKNGDPQAPDLTRQLQAPDTHTAHIDIKLKWYFSIREL